MIAAIVVVLVAAGSGVGLLVNSRLHPAVNPTASKVTSRPTAAPVGEKTVAQAQQAVLLSIVNTSPTDASVNVPLTSSITLSFNLPTDPAAVKSFLTVLVGDAGYSVIPGTLSQGKTATDVVFKPSQTFDYAASVSVTVRNGLQSRDGTQLGNDYAFGFSTAPEPQTVSFGARLVNAASGRPVSLPLIVGDGTTEEGIRIQTYKAASKQLLAGLVYSSKSGDFLDSPIDVSPMQLMDPAGASLTASGARTTDPVKADGITVAEPDGIYLVLALIGNRQVGFVWVDFSKFGVLLRQDDQKIVVAGQDLTTGVNTQSFAITFYSLRDGVVAKSSGTFAGTAEFAAKFPSGIDVAVATTGGEDVVVPMSVPSTGAFIGVGANLAVTPQVFLTTDRRAYVKGETVRFAGVARLSNDQAYALGTMGKIEVWSYQTTKSLAVVSVAADGTFSGSFPIPANAFAPDGTDSVFTVLASAVGSIHGDPNVPQGTTDVITLGPHAPLSTLTVALNKPTYLANENVVATITGRNSKGLPLAVQTVNLTVYVNQLSNQPSEYDSFPQPGTFGEPALENVKVKLDNSGRATYTFKANVGGKKTNEDLTVAVGFGSGKVASIAAKTARVYQAADDVFLLGHRYTYQQGDTIVSDFVVESRDGARVAAMPMAYELDRIDYQGDQTIRTVVVGGTVSTDANGRGTIRATYGGEPASLVLRVIGKDQAGNSFEDQTELYANLQGGASQLDFATDKLAYSVGDTAHISVTAPAATAALMSLERGRVHQYRWVQLSKGDNTISVEVTPDLAPGFFVVFSYFEGGTYLSDQTEVYVNNLARVLKVTLTADKTGYTKGETAHVTIAVTDGTGTPVAATLVGDGYDAHMSAYKVVDQNSIAAAFLTPSRLSTNSSSSLATIGSQSGGGCGGGSPIVLNSPYAGRTAVWLPRVTTDATGHATIDVPITGGTVRLSVMAATVVSTFGQAEIDLGAS
ncbi:MAG TPA: Ig-like domain-containing protein [Candidatus Dormibacteraeota bacterium]